MAFYLYPLLAFLATLSLIPLAARIAVTLGYTDDPGGRKTHGVPTPPIGGVVFVPIFLLCVAFSHVMDLAMLWPLYVAIAVILLTGFLDDKWHLPPTLKFFLHFLSAFILVLPANTVITDLGHLFDLSHEFDLGFFAVPFTVACIVYLINAMNMADGVDGLAGGIAFVVVASLGYAALASGAIAFVGMIAILLATLAGFLCHNVRTPFQKQARVFMGDAGSMSLGVIIAFLGIHLAQDPINAISPITLAWIIALPIFDSFGLFVRRIREGKHPFFPDRMHLHHHFLDTGYRPSAASLIICLWAAFYGAIGFSGLPEPVLTGLWILLWIGHTFLTLKPEPFRKRLGEIRTQWLS